MSESNDDSPESSAASKSFPPFLSPQNGFLYLLALPLLSAHGLDGPFPYPLWRSALKEAGRISLEELRDLRFRRFSPPVHAVRVFLRTIPCRSRSRRRPADPPEPSGQGPP